MLLQKINFLKRAIPASLLFIIVFSKHLRQIMSKICWWLDTNRGVGSDRSTNWDEAVARKLPNFLII